MLHDMLSMLSLKEKTNCFFIFINAAQNHAKQLDYSQGGSLSYGMFSMPSLRDNTNFDLVESMHTNNRHWLQR